MARAIADARSEGLPVAQALGDAAREQGRALASVALQQAGDSPPEAALLGAAREVLDQEGFETRLADADTEPAGLILANCPFHALAVRNTDVICGMNLAIMEGLLEGLPRLPLAPVLDPAEGRCCVRLAADGHSST
jgi:predicted ArsR family transcriptional regulator